MIRTVSIIVATLLFCYIVFVSFFFRESRQKELCRDLQVVVVDSLDKHFVSESDLVHILKKADLNPIEKPMDEVNTDRIENELLKNEMIARVEAYKTPSGMIKLEVEQKIPILRVISPRGNYYVDNLGSDACQPPLCGARSGGERICGKRAGGNRLIQICIIFAGE